MNVEKEQALEYLRSLQRKIDSEVRACEQRLRSLQEQSVQNFAAISVLEELLRSGEEKKKR